MSEAEVAQIASLMATMNAHLVESREVKEVVFERLNTSAKNHEKHFTFENEIKNDIKWILRIGVTLLLLGAPQAVEFVKVLFIK